MSGMEPEDHLHGHDDDDTHGRKTNLSEYDPVKKRHRTAFEKFTQHLDDYHVVKSALSTGKSVVAGGIAGMVAKSVVAPVDRIKILFQVSSERFSVTKVVRTMNKIRHEEGIRGLWKGNSATMLRVFPYAGIQFMTFDKIKARVLRLKDDSRGQLTNIESLLAGSFAGFVSCLCTYPLDYARARLAVEARRADSRHSVSYIFKNAYEEGGFRQLYRGLIPTMLGILPYAGVAFTINDKAKHQVRKWKNAEPTTLQRLACGAFAGLTAQSATYPLDVVRRRMQTSGIASPGLVEESIVRDRAANIAGNTSKALRPHASMLDILQAVYRDEGIRGLFKGLSINWIKGPIALSISFTTFDLLKRHFKVHDLR